MKIPVDSKRVIILNLMYSVEQITKSKKKHVLVCSRWDGIGPKQLNMVSKYLTGVHCMKIFAYSQNAVGPRGSFLANPSFLSMCAYARAYFYLCSCFGSLSRSFRQDVVWKKRFTASDFRRVISYQANYA